MSPFFQIVMILESFSSTGNTPTRRHLLTLCISGLTINSKRWPEHPQTIHSNPVFLFLMRFIMWIIKYIIYINIIIWKYFLFFRNTFSKYLRNCFSFKYVSFSLNVVYFQINLLYNLFLYSLIYGTHICEDRFSVLFEKKESFLNRYIYTITKYRL